MNTLQITDGIREEWDDTCPFCDGSGHKNFASLDESELEDLRNDWRKRRGENATNEELTEFLRDNPNKTYPTELDLLTSEQETALRGEFAAALEPDDDDELETFFEDERVEIDCDECSDGRCEVLWDTAFHVDLRSYAFENSRRTAWGCNGGFLLFEHDGAYWLGMGSCGQDNTWLIHYCRWKLQGWLAHEDIQGCLSSSGWCHIGAKAGRELLDYMATTIPSDEEAVQNVQRQRKQLADIQARMK